jgi:hypothetical protein
MNAAAAYIANANHAAQDWARAQAARTMVRAAMNSDGVVYRRTWPEQGMPCEADYRARRACDAWLDSTLALRDGLSVVEVFDSIDESAALHDFALAGAR